MSHIHAAIASTPEGDATRALRAARDTIIDLKRRLPFAKYAAVEDPGLEATGYHFELSEDTHETRLSLHRGAHRNVLGWLILKSPDVYEFSNVAMRNYDKLEGIE